VTVESVSVYKVHKRHLSKPARVPDLLPACISSFPLSRSKCFEPFKAMQGGGEKEKNYNLALKGNFLMRARDSSHKSTVKYSFFA
jgi:hypothetical protein